MKKASKQRTKERATKTLVRYKGQINSKGHYRDLKGSDYIEPVKVGRVLSHENKYITVAARLPNTLEEAASSTIATLSSLAKNLGLHKSGPNRIGNTNPVVFMENTNILTSITLARVSEAKPRVHSQTSSPYQILK